MSELVRRRQRHSLSNRTLDTAVTVLIVLFCVLCLIPFVVAVSSSFSDERTLLTRGYSLAPVAFTTAAYDMLFSTRQIADSYKVSIFVTVAGTALSMVVTAMMAYPLSVKKLRYRGGISFFAYFTMDGPQRVTVGSRRVRWVCLTQLIKCDQPSAFPALRQLMAYGRDPQAEEA